VNDVMKLVIVAKMSDDKLLSKILPIANLDEVELIYLIRQKPFEMEKVKSLTLPPFFAKKLIIAEFYRFICLIFLCLIKKADVIVSFYFFPHGLIAGIVGILTRRKVIHAIIGSDLPRVVSSRIWLNLLKRAHRVAVRGHRSKEELISRGVPAERLFIPPNFIDLTYFSPKNAEKNISNKKKYDLIHLGSLIQSKNLKQLLDIISQVQRELPHIRVVMVGEGPERDNLINFAKQLQIMDIVEFVGFCPKKDVVDYINRSRVFIMTSLHEGLPMAMVEAISCGLPVIMPDVGDVTDYAYHNVNAIIVDPASTENFVREVISLLLDESRYIKLSKGAVETRRKFAIYFSLDNIKQIWKKVLVDV
jgi:glycosyltransferase involved in cell wall biosynthesis